MILPVIQQFIQVLICTHNRSTLLRRTVHFLNNAERPDNCKILLYVVANACTDDTHRFLQEYQNNADPNILPLKWIEEPVPGKSNALNTALPQLDCDIIAMVDDDHRVDNDYFIAIEKALQNHPNADFFCGKILPDWDGSEPVWVHDHGKYRIYPLPVPRFDLGDQSMRVIRDIAVPGGGNLVIKRELLSRIGDFSPSFGPVGHNLGGAEDIEWVIRAYKAGAKLQYLPEMIQYHYVDTERLTLGYVIKKAYERTSSAVRLDENAQNFSCWFPFPRYLITKLFNYLIYALFSLSVPARRFYLVRFAATLGEIKGFLMAKKENA